MIDLAEILTKIKPYVLGWTTGTLSGTANPPAPVVGQTFFRSDLGWWIYWNGTYWLTAHEYSSELHRGGYAVTTDLLQAALRTDYKPFFTRVAGSVLVATTLTASDYWIVYWMCRSVGEAQADWLHNPDIKPAMYAAGTWYHIEAAVNRASTLASPAKLAWYVQRVGNPGVISVEQVTFYRLIVT